MGQVNQKRVSAPAPRNHGGSVADRQSAYSQLRRTLMCCLLWESNFYESGVSVADRIKSLVPQVDADKVAALAIEARSEHGLRHAPLLVVREMARGTAEQRALVPSTMAGVIRRPDEIAEFLAMYWADNDGKKFVSHPVRRGIAAALGKFETHALAKWDKPGKEVRIRDAMFMSHAKPKGLPGNAPKWSAAERKADYKAGSTRAWPFTEAETKQFQLAQQLLKQEGTWEDRMSAGESAKVVFEDLMSKGQLGALAYIRNLRKMTEAGVDDKLIRAYSRTVKLWGVLPHQLITTARVNKQFEPEIDAMLLRSVVDMSKLPGHTAVLVDISRSMDAPLSKQPSYGKPGAHASPVPETTRIDAAAAVAIMARELCDTCSVFSFSTHTVEVPARRGMALLDAISKSQSHGGTAMANAITHVGYHCKYDRLIVITDEQSQDGGADPLPGSKAYMINVAIYKNGVKLNDKKWTRIDGWSPTVVRFIAEIESARETVDA